MPDFKSISYKLQLCRFPAHIHSKFASTIQKTMRTKIAGYAKTDHFQYRQRDRGLSDYQLTKILNRIDFKDANYVLVIGNAILRKLKIPPPFNKNLISKIYYMYYTTS